MEERYHQRLLEHTGSRIRFYRKLCNMSQDQLAAAIHKSESTLSKYERGAISPDVVTLYDIAHALNIEVSQLLDYSAPTQAAKAPTSHLFGGCSKLHMYYYEAQRKKFSHGIIEFLPQSEESNVLPCRCYIDIPPSGACEDCLYFHTGSLVGHETVSYLTLQNHTMKSARLSVYILNPVVNKACAWGILTGIAHGYWSLYFYKVMLCVEAVPISELDAKEFCYSKEEMKFIKQLNMLPIKNPII